MDSDDLTFNGNKLRFRHPLVAEMAWIIGSAPTMSQHRPGGIWNTLDQKWYQNAFHDHLAWLDALEEKPKVIEDHFVNSEKLLLGKRFEKFISFWFEQSPLFDLLLHSVQVKGPKRTIGEIDFVIRDLLREQVLHLEVACKFYLCYRNSSAWDHWIGPNGKDSLKLKMDKLQKQLSIFDREEARLILQDRLIPSPQPTLLMKGYFFHHFKAIAQHKNPKYSSSNYPSGWYAHISELGQFPGDKGKWIILQKYSWLSPVHKYEDYEVYPAKNLLDELRERFKKAPRAVLIARIYEEDNLLIEIDRGFVVRDQWPAR